MINLKLTTATLIVVLIQVCTANTIYSKVENDVSCYEQENDPAKLLSEDELLLAQSVGIPPRDLVGGKCLGYTFEEMIQIHTLTKTPWSKEPLLEQIIKMCEILVPGRKMGSNYTSAQKEDLLNLMDLIPYIPFQDRLPFFRTSVCGYVNQPHLNPFNPKVVTYIQIRFFKIGANDATGFERVKLAKQICCIDKGGKILDKSKLTPLLDEEMYQLVEQWSDFDTTNLSESIKKLCDFLHAKNSVDDGQCQKNDSSR